MKDMEIERKFLLKRLPENLESFPFKKLEQAYLTTDPVIRVRRSSGGKEGEQEESFELTYKGKGLLAREEYNLPLTKEAYFQLLQKAEGNRIAKQRYYVPLEASGLTVELDVFEPPFAPLIMAEVEFSSEEQAERFVPPEWFDKEVTHDTEYHNSTMSRRKF